MALAQPVAQGAVVERRRWVDRVPEIEVLCVGQLKTTGPLSKTKAIPLKFWLYSSYGLFEACKGRFHK